jgi:hypothetical protein
MRLVVRRLESIRGAKLMVANVYYAVSKDMDHYSPKDDSGGDCNLEGGFWGGGLSGVTTFNIYLPLVMRND